MPNLKTPALWAITISLCAAGASAQRYTDERYDLALIQQQSSIEPADVAAGDDVGASLAMSERYIVAGTPGRDVDGQSNAGCVYVFDASTEALLYTLYSPTPTAGDEFGAAVALDGDLLCVGVRNDDELVEDGGAVFVFDLSTGDLIEKLFPEDPEPIDRFGFGVAIGPDHIGVGIANDNEAGAFVGSVEVFDRQTLGRLGKLLPDEPEGINGMGVGLWISGHTLVAGAYPSDLVGNNSGAVLIFDLDTMSHRYTAVGSDSAEDDEFGRAAAVAGGRLYVGAPGKDDFGTDSGGVYMFDLETGDELAKLWSHDTAPGNNLGNSVHAQGEHLVVGARRADSNRGRAYLFNTHTGAFRASFQRDAIGNGDQYGVAVAVQGDEVVVSSARARADDNNRGGKLYRFGVGEDRYPDHVFVGEDCESNRSDFLGDSIDIDDDILVAAGHFSGRCVVPGPGVHVFDLSTMETVRVITDIPKLPDSIEGMFGASVAVGDGVIAVGDPHMDRANWERTGGVSLFDLATGEFMMMLAPSELRSYDQFGISLDIDDGVLAVGCREVDAGGVTDAGAVYLYALPSGQLIRKQASPSPQPFAAFGSSVHLDAGQLIVGAPEATGQTDGEAYLFEAATGSLLRTFTHGKIKGTNASDFGSTVHMHGDMIFIADTTAYNTASSRWGGQLYVYDRETGELLAQLLAETEYNREHFGWSVRADDETIYVGTWREYVSSNQTFGGVPPRVDRFDAKTFERLSPIRGSYGNGNTNFGRAIAVGGGRVAASMPNGNYGFTVVPDLGGAIFVYDKPQDNTCPADLTGDGELNFFDVSAFIVAFAAGDLGVDFNGDGELNFFDVSAFIVAYSGGCP